MIMGQSLNPEVIREKYWNSQLAYPTLALGPIIQTAHKLVFIRVMPKICLLATRLMGSLRLMTRKRTNDQQNNTMGSSL